MRFNKIVFFIILCSYMFAAKTLIDVTYEQTQDKSFVVNIKPNKKIASYTTKNGVKIEKGTKLMLGRALDGNVHTSVNKGGIFGGGNSVSSTAVFATIAPGTFDGNMAMAVFGGTTMYLPSTTTGEELIVEEISLGKATLKKTSPRIVRVFAKNTTGGVNIVAGRTIMDLEKALLIGEIIDPNAPLTKEEAIAKLIESKDLLELELLSQDEYDKLKSELSPIIRGQ